MNKENALSIFDLPPTFTKQEIRQKWRQLAKIHYPDISGDAEKFMELKKAYDFLLEYREKYPTEQDWETIFSSEQDFSYECVYSTPHTSYKEPFEINFIYLSVVLAIMAILYILILNTQNTFVRGIWYSLSIGLPNISIPSLSFKKLLTSILFS